MKFAREIWNPAEMCAMPSFYSPTPDPRSDLGRRRANAQTVDRLDHLPAPDLAARAKYPADVEVETLADGGALVTLCEEPFGKTDSGGLARLHALEAALRPIQS